MTRLDPWSPRYIYLYLVCIVTLVMVIFATVNLVRSVVELVYPQPVMAFAPEPLKAGDVDAEALAAAQREQERNQRQWATRNAVLSIIGNATLLVIAGPLYLYHWRKVERERRLSGEATSSER